MIDHWLSGLGDANSFELIAGLHLQWPELLLLLPLPWLIRRYFPAARQNTAALTIPQYDALAGLNQQVSAQSDSRAPLASLIAMWVFLLLAAAQPVWFGDAEPIPTAGRDLMLAVDISDSMRVDDIISANAQKQTRLTAVKQVVSEFVQARQYDRIGLILFGHQSFVQAPLTFDHRTVTIQLGEAMAGFAGSSTAIGDVLGLAIKVLRERPVESRVLVLLTDGANTAGSDPRQAASIAAEAQIRIHTIGIGAAGRIVGNPSGETRWLDSSEELDVQLLRDIASTTNGQFFRAHDTNEMRAVYQAIDSLEPSPEPQTFRPQRSLFHWPLAIGLLLALILLFTQTNRVAP